MTAHYVNFRRVRKIAKTVSFIMSVRLPAGNYSAPTKRIFVKFDRVFL